MVMPRRTIPALVATALLAGCQDRAPSAPPPDTTRGGGGTSATTNTFRCVGSQFVEARIALDATGDASAIVDTSGGALDTITVERNQRVRWRISDANPQDYPFYVVFNGNQTPSKDNRKKGETMAGSSSNEGVQELCMKIHPQAAGGSYRYSVFVKYCHAYPDTCRPRVLDPIIYVR